MKDIRGLGRREQLRIRGTEHEREAFAEAARISGLSLSSWARMAMREAAIDKLIKAGRGDIAGKLTQ